MLSTGQIPLSNDERTAIEQLLAELDEQAVTLTRRDAGESGPVLVQAAARAFEISAGKVTELV